MGPVTRSRTAQKSKPDKEVKARKVLGDKTNMSEKTRETNKTKSCVYAHKSPTELAISVPQEEGNVYDFISTDSPPRNIKKKRKRKPQKKVSDTTDDENSPIKPVKRVLRTKTRQKRNALPDTGKNTASDLSEENKNGSALLEKGGPKRMMKRAEIRQKRNISSVTTKNAVKDLSDNVNKENIVLKESTKQKINLNFKETKDDCLKSPLHYREKGSFHTELNKDEENSEILILSGKEAKSNSTSLREKVSKPEKEPDISHNSLDKENSPPKSYSEHCFLSPIQQVPNSIFVTKRNPRRKPLSVEEFTIDNYFGFDEESEDEISLTMGVSSHHFAESSTPYVKSKPTRPPYQVLRTLSIRNSQSIRKLTPLSRSGTYKALPDSSKMNSVSVAKAIIPIMSSLKPSSDEKSSGEGSDTLAVPLSTTGLPDKISTHSEVSSSAPVKVNLTSKTVICAPPCSSSAVSSETLTNSHQYTASSSSASFKHDVPGEVVTAASSNPSPVLFGDDVLPECFSKPPRRSYERIRHQSSQSEAETESDDEAHSKKRTNMRRKCKAKEVSQSEEGTDSEAENNRKKQTKGTKKRKAKEVVVEKWAANISAQFDEIESFELCVE